MRPAERAQLAMMLEVTAFPKPGNVDRCHDYDNETDLEHFLASLIFARPALEEAELRQGGIGEIIRHAVLLTNRHKGGNTHFGAFILLIPLLYGADIEGAKRVISQTDVSDALHFFQAFSLTSVFVPQEDELDIHDPQTLVQIRERNMTLYGVMEHSAHKDLVAREWITGFSLTRYAADLLIQTGPGRRSIVNLFLSLLASVPDTFIQKKHGIQVAEEVRSSAQEVLEGKRRLEDLDRELIERGINPGSLADITIAGIFIALGEGWSWES